MNINNDDIFACVVQTRCLAKQKMPRQHLVGYEGHWLSQADKWCHSGRLTATDCSSGAAWVGNGFFLWLSCNAPPLRPGLAASRGIASFLLFTLCPSLTCSTQLWVFYRCWVLSWSHDGYLFSLKVFCATTWAPRGWGWIAYTFVSELGSVLHFASNISMTELLVWSLFL